MAHALGAALVLFSYLEQSSKPISGTMQKKKRGGGKRPKGKKLAQVWGAARQQVRFFSPSFIKSIILSGSLAAIPIQSKAEEQE